MELIDVLNSDGKKTGEIVPKSEIHVKGLWHCAAHVWLVNSQNEILLQLRARGVESHAGKWDISTAGHVSAGEDALTTAVREAQEELGITLAMSDFIHIGEVVQSGHHKGYGYVNNEFNDVYVVRNDFKVTDFNLQKSEVEEVRWVPFSTFKEMVDTKDPSLLMHEAEYELLFKYLGL